MAVSQKQTSDLLLSELDFESPIIKPLADLEITTVGQYLSLERSWLVCHKGITHNMVRVFNRKLVERGLDPRSRHA